MQAMLALESFADDPPPDPGLAAAYDAGFRAGVAQGRQDAMQEGTGLQAELVQNLSDLAFTYQEARQDIMQSLDPLVRALIHSVLPHCVKTGFADQIADLVLRTCGPDCDQALTVHVHPDQCAAVTAATLPIASLVHVCEDPCLTPQAAWIGQAGAEIQIDMDRHLAAITALLANLSASENRITPHG